MPKVGPKLFDNPALEILFIAKHLPNWRNQKEVLLAYYARCGEGYYCCFEAIAKDLDLDYKRTRTLTRRLARKGLLEYGAGLFTCDGEVAGAGYTITSKGRAVARIIEEPEHEDRNGT